MQNLSITGFQLSPQQKRLWLLQQSNSESPYQVRGEILIEGNLRREILETTIEKVINKHEILRTTFHTLPGMTIPLQVITNPYHPTISYCDLSHLDSEEQKNAIASQFNRSDRQDFDIFLLFLAPKKHLLLIGFSAILGDTKSLKNLVEEISRYYAACLSDRELLDEPLQYVDIAQWQNELFEGDEAELGKQYWRNQKISISLNPKLPDGNNSALTSDFTPQFLSWKFNQNTVAKLQAIARQYDTSIENILQTCWQILLWRLTGQSKIVIGTFCEGRNYEELESALGLFAKYLPVSCELEENILFHDLLKQISDLKEEVFKWQESFTWEQIVSVDEKTSDVPFFPFCFEFEEVSGRYSAVDVIFSLEKYSARLDRFTVKLACQQRHDALTAEFHYDANQFSADAIAQLADRFVTLLENALKSPQAAIGELEIVSERERQQLMVEFNQTQQNFPQNRCIHHLFEEQAARTPDRIAVVFEGQQLTYSQLNTKANQLAHYLKQLGVDRETIVGLCVDRSLEMIIGLLGILKAGGAYLPLDPQLPNERLTFMVRDAQVRFLLTQQDLEKRFSEQIPQIVCLDTDWNNIGQQPAENPQNSVTSDNLIYLIYTSGSTGQPKGVANEHRQLLNYLYGILETLNLPAGSSFATVSTFAADLGNTAIFSALCTGGCLHVISQERAMNPDAFAQYCDRYPIDCLKIVPSHLNALLSASDPKKFLPNCLILGGETLSWQLVERVKQYAPDCQIFNHYGPTETTVGVLTYRVTSHREAKTVPLGRPLANTQVYLLDSYLKPVPIGVAGEIYIGGASVARGYFNRPTLTQQKFVRVPFTQSTLYKTGDLARYLPNGNLEFLGRIDHQVKLHGFRIELEEIESLLRQHPTIREAIALVREDSPGQPRLVAYVVVNNASEYSPSELRDFLKAKLPDYAIPATFVGLKALPLTANGKIDRQALPAPDRLKPELAGTFVAPRTAQETTLARIWTQVLGLPQVGIYDNFFELGGDSILSLQIIARANQAGLQISPKQLFEFPTIDGLAAVAKTPSTIHAEQGIVTGSLPLTPIQHWFFEQQLPDPHHWNQALLLEVQSALDPALLAQAIQELRKHHDSLRLQFSEGESGWQSFNAPWDENDPIPFSCIDLSERKSDFNAIADRLQASLDLSTGQLMRVALFDFGETQPQRLLWIIHHLVVDGVSWRVLLEDLQTAYEQLKQGQVVQLPPKTLSFKQWAERLQDYARTEGRQRADGRGQKEEEGRQEAEGRWQKEGEGRQRAEGRGQRAIVGAQGLRPRQKEEERNDLPVDFMGGSNTLAQARTLSVTLNEAETQGLLQEVPTVYRTQINDVLLTALVQAFAQWTGKPKLLVDLEGHGREAIAQDIDLSRTVGWFTTLFPVLLTLEGIYEPGEALKAIKEQLRSIPDRGLNYGVLRYLSRDELLPTLPQAEVRFNYLGRLDPMLPKTSPFKLLNQSPGTTRSLRSHRCYLLDINGFVLGNRLQLDWTYSQQIHQQSTIERLATGFIEALRSLIAHCQSPDAGGYTPTDFPQAKLDSQDLDKFLSKINSVSGKNRP